MASLPLGPSLGTLAATETQFPNTKSSHDEGPRRMFFLGFYAFRIYRNAYDKWEKNSHISRR